MDTLELLNEYREDNRIESKQALGRDPYHSSYYRCGEGNFRFPHRELETMLREQNAPSPLSAL